MALIKWAPLHEIEDMCDRPGSFLQYLDCADHIDYPSRIARVAELVDALDLGSSPHSVDGGSIPPSRTSSGWNLSSSQRYADQWRPGVDAQGALSADFQSKRKVSCRLQWRVSVV